MHHMRPAFHYQSAGPDLKPAVKPDEPRQTLEGADHDGVTIDGSSPSYSVKIESPSSSAALAQYSGTIGSSLTPSESYSTGEDQPDTTASRRSSDSLLPYRSLATAKQEGKYAIEDGSCSPGPLAVAVRPAKPVQYSKIPTRHHLQPEIWERYKEEIHELYIEENKSLNELMDIMQAKGFGATPRMYKAKFAQWGFVKNNKKKDVAMMLRLQRERGAVGKPTAFRRHGRSVDIETYMKRKGISSFELVTPVAGVDLPEYLRALTPPPVEPQHMTLPSHLHAQEVLVSCFKDLTLGWRDSLESPASFEKDFNTYFDVAYLWQKGPLDERSVKLARVALRLDVSGQYDWTNWVAWRVIAQFHRSRCDVDNSAVKDHPRHALARYALERAIDTAEAGRGFSELQVFENMQLLEAWHREAGDTEQELVVRRRREKGLQDYLESLQRSRGVEMPNTPTSQ
ncbi:hypothetical protein GL218_03835 [Daldinia childiae]|uniref:uncharacterized protein n=1 Tax=Daldinia childiae TaxID=326645 RepID=UPI00144842E3|nr:uncharacterized protein GL218_03835 [Daldinia childiae]KAF3062415.1 hypothetical protein GL218_03835 [Daldinia childiae]